MNKAFFVFAVVALATLCVAEDSKVVVLKKDNFDKIVNEADTILVKFFAPWCGHCKHLAPEFIKAAEILDKEGIILAEVDCTEETELADRFEVHGYPTLYIFHKGEKTEYKGPREANGIVKYMRAQAGPAAKPLENAEALEQFIARKDDIKFVAYTKEDSKIGVVFKKIANTLRENYVFGISPATDKYTDKIVAHRNFDKEDKEIVYAGKDDADELRKWIQETSVPLAGVYDENTKDRYGSLPILYVYGKVSAENDPAGLRYILNRLRPIAKEFKGKLHFVAADNHDNNFHEMNFDENKKYQIAIVDGDKLYKSEIDGLKKDEIKAFAQLLLTARLSSTSRVRLFPVLLRLVKSKSLSVRLSTMLLPRLRLILSSLLMPHGAVTARLFFLPGRSLLRSTTLTAARFVSPRSMLPATSFLATLRFVATHLSSGSLLQG